MPPFEAEAGVEWVADHRGCAAAVTEAASWLPRHCGSLRGGRGAWRLRRRPRACNTSGGSVEARHPGCRCSLGPEAGAAATPAGGGHSTSRRAGNDERAALAGSGSSSSSSGGPRRSLVVVVVTCNSACLGSTELRCESGCSMRPRDRGGVAIEERRAAATPCLGPGLDPLVARDLAAARAPQAHAEQARAPNETTQTAEPRSRRRNNTPEQRWLCSEAASAKRRRGPCTNPSDLAA